MISVQNLRKDFGPRRAVNDVTFSVEKGTVLGFLGPNGAGKTTTIRLIAGYLKPKSGKVAVDGCDVVLDPVAAQKKIGYMPENTPLYDDMTVTGFLRFLAEIRGFQGAKRNKRVDEVLDACFLNPVRHQSIDTLSKGYRQRTCFAQTLLHDPPILLLDEPTEGLDPNQKKIVRDMISVMRKDKVIMLSTHVLEEVEAMCTRAIIISQGKIVADSTPTELKKRSASYNTVTVNILTREPNVDEALRGIGDVGEVEVLETSDDAKVLKLTPKDKQPLAACVLEFARDKKWAVRDLQTGSGRLDEVFRELTETEDATSK